MANEVCIKCSERPRAKGQRWCNDCANAYRRQRYKDDPEYRERRKQGRTTNDKGRKRHPSEAREVRARLKREVFDHYGARCVCCDEHHYEFLTIDHIDGRPSSHRGKNGDALYRLVKHEGFPEIYRVLCWNCNASRGVHGYCPHETKEM